MSSATAPAAIACLLCASRRHEVVRTVQNLDPNTDRLIPSMGVSLCRDCGLIYQNPCISEKQMDALYEKIEDKITETHTDTVTLAENQSRLKALLRLKAPPARVLEIGCSDGTFLSLAQEAGYEVVGIDPSEVNCQKAARSHPGLDVRRLFLDGFAPGETFDAICHFFVLEHIFHPDQYLSQIRGLLKPGGIMYFEIPNVETFAKLPFANNLFIYQHVAHYCPATVRALLARHGFKTLAVDGKLGRSPKSYGMRVAAQIAPKKAAAKPKNVYPAGKRLLAGYFARREKILAKIETRVAVWLKNLRPGPVVIFGAGENGRILRSTSLAKTGRTLHFTDNNTAIQGTPVDGLTVLKPAEVPALAPALVIAASIDYQDDMVRQMLDLGVPEERLVKLYEGF
jgi:SAM-dependent methyltransferase